MIVSKLVRLKHKVDENKFSLQFHNLAENSNWSFLKRLVSDEELVMFRTQIETCFKNNK